MIHFEGERHFDRPYDEVFAKLGDASFLVGCLKDVEPVGQTSADRASWKFKPQFSFISTKLDITLDILERSPNSDIKTRLVSRGIGASATVETRLHIETEGDGARVRWSADVTELTGLLKLAPKGLISSTAHKVIDETWAEIAARI